MKSTDKIKGYRKLKTFEEIKSSDKILSNEKLILVDKSLVDAHWTEHLVQVYRKENETITKEFLKEIGFQKSNDKKYEKTYKQTAFIKEKRKEFTDCYSLRIHDLTWLAYDLKDGFVELRRKNENHKKNNVWVTIILPKPYRTKKELKKLLEVIC